MSGLWLVTGASGFVGRHALRELAESGLAAEGIYRSTPKGSAAAHARVVSTWERGALREAFRGASGIVHAASIVHSPKTPEAEYERFNVEGTRALVEAAREAGVRRLVFVSSIKVYGEDTRGTIDEHTLVAPEGGYARTKAEGEEIVLAATDLRPIVLRLCPVYGRGDKGNVRTVARAIAHRRFMIPGDGSARKSIVHVSTVAKVVKAAALGRATGAFVVADRYAPSMRELASTIAEALGRGRPRSLPAPLLRAVAGVVESVAKRAHVSTPISRALIAKSMTSSVCDPTRVERELGTECHVDLDWAIRDEIAWLRESRLL